MKAGVSFSTWKGITLPSFRGFSCKDSLKAYGRNIRVLRIERQPEF
jgi:hypothetical protein